MSSYFDPWCKVSWTDGDEEFYRFHEDSLYPSNVRDLTGLSDKALFRQKGQNKILPGTWVEGTGTRVVCDADDDDDIDDDADAADDDDGGGGLQRGLVILYLLDFQWRYQMARRSEDWPRSVKHSSMKIQSR